jgi:hypothetical protein
MGEPEVRILEYEPVEPGAGPRYGRVRTTVGVFGLGMGVVAFFWMVVWFRTDPEIHVSWLRAVVYAILNASIYSLLGMFLMMSTMLAQRAYGKRLPRRNLVRGAVAGVVYEVGCVFLWWMHRLEAMEDTTYARWWWVWALGYVWVVSYVVTEFCAEHKRATYMR